ncbi:MAG: hypothetical protein V2A62_05685 [Candidatus Woesearchaeota archaeon]
MLETLLRPIRRGLVGLLFIGAVACGSAEGYAPCSSNNDCSQGRICSTKGECIEQPDCGNGKCDAYLQENCATCPQDCGKCKELCDICSTDADCFDGKGDNRCITGLFNTSSYNDKGVCGRGCSTDENCPEGYVCKEFKIASGETLNQCYSQSAAEHSTFGEPICPTEKYREECEYKSGTIGCEGDSILACGSDFNGKVYSFNCFDFGLQCFEKNNGGTFPFVRCYGHAQLGDPCKDTDCDPYTKEDLWCDYIDSEKRVCLPRNCQKDDQCPDKFYCATDWNDECSVIDSPCTTDKECRKMGFVECKGAGEHRHCIGLPFNCNKNEDCPKDYFCGNQSKECVFIEVSCSNDEECKAKGYDACYQGSSSWCGYE